jgi:hypothetical protein
MQEDETTNLALANPRSVGSNSCNLQISSKSSRQLTMEAGTNEVALWAPQPYIVPFSKLPHSVTGAQSLCFLIHLQPWDQDPTTYTVTFLGHHPYSALGEHFSHITPRYACSCSKLSNNFICSLSSDIVHVRYSVLMCAGTWSSQTTQPLQVYDRH